MAIYKLFDEKKEALPEHNRVHFDDEEPARDRLFSTVAARFFFFILMLTDIVWLSYTVLRIALSLPCVILTWGKVRFFKRALSSLYLSLKRGLVSLLALFVSLFSPALGIMFSCTYFVMYDREGIDEVVPNSLRPQFHDFLSLSE